MHWAANVMCTELSIVLRSPIIMLNGTYHGEILNKTPSVIYFNNCFTKCKTYCKTKSAISSKNTSLISINKTLVTLLIWAKNYNASFKIRSA